MKPDEKQRNMKTNICCAYFSTSIRLLCVCVLFLFLFISSTMHASDHWSTHIEQRWVWVVRERNAAHTELRTFNSIHICHPFESDLLHDPKRVLNSTSNVNAKICVRVWVNWMSVSPFAQLFKMIKRKKNSWKKFQHFFFVYACNDYNQTKRISHKSYTTMMTMMMMAMIVGSQLLLLHIFMYPLHFTTHSQHAASLSRL